MFGWPQITSCCIGCPASAIRARCSRGSARNDAKNAITTQRSDARLATAIIVVVGVVVVVIVPTSRRRKSARSAIFGHSEFRRVFPQALHSHTHTPTNALHFGFPFTRSPANVGHPRCSTGHPQDSFCLIGARSLAVTQGARSLLPPRISKAHWLSPELSVCTTVEIAIADCQQDSFLSKLARIATSTNRNGLSASFRFWRRRSVNSGPRRYAHQLEESNEWFRLLFRPLRLELEVTNVSDSPVGGRWPVLLAFSDP